MPAEPQLVAAAGQRLAGRAVADHGDPDVEPVPDEPQRLDQQVLALLFRREAGGDQQPEARAGARSRPGERHAAHVDADVGDEAGPRLERHPDLGRPRGDERARGLGEEVDRVDAVEHRGDRRLVAALADRLVPAEPGHPHHDRHAWGRRGRVAAAERPAQELDLVEGIEESGRRRSGPGRRAAGRPGPRRGARARGSPDRRRRLEQQPPRTRRSRRGFGSSSTSSPFRRIRRRRARVSGRSEAKRHPVAARGEALGDQPHRGLGAADPLLAVGRDLGEEENVHAGPGLARQAELEPIAAALPSRAPARRGRAA